MHKVINFIVYAKTENEAKDNAEILLDTLVERGVYDYGTFFDDDTKGASGQARWGEKTPVVDVESNEGKDIIEEGMKYTKEEFMNNLQKIRRLLKEFNNEELFEEDVIDKKKKIIEELGVKDENKKDLTLFKHFCSCVGGSYHSGIFLYDSDGEAISNQNHLNNVLTKWNCVYEGKSKENPHRQEDIFMIPCDVHY